MKDDSVENKIEEEVVIVSTFRYTNKRAAMVAAVWYEVLGVSVGCVFARSVELAAGFAKEGKLWSAAELATHAALFFVLSISLVLLGLATAKAANNTGEDRGEMSKDGK